MKKSNLTKKFMTVAIIFTATFSLTGCANTKPAAEQVKDITEAYKSGDSKTFYKSMEKNETYDHYFDAVEKKPTSGLGSFYVKLNEKAKDITVKPDEKDKTFDIPVEISSYDAYDVAIKKMYAAAKKGPEAFADMPTWLCAALDDAKVTTDSVKFNTRTTDSSSIRYLFNSNKNFFKNLTFGLSDFMDATITTCKKDKDVTCLLAQGDEVLFSADYYYTSLKGTGLSKAQVKQYTKKLIKEYKKYKKVLTDVTYDGKGITQVVFIDYSTVSTVTLHRLGLISSSSVGSISLKKTIDGFKSEGLTCVTDTFGITPKEEKEK